MAAFFSGQPSYVDVSILCKPPHHFQEKCKLPDQKALAHSLLLVAIVPTSFPAPGRLSLVRVLVPSALPTKVLSTPSRLALNGPDRSCALVFWVTLFLSLCVLCSVAVLVLCRTRSCWGRVTLSLTLSIMPATEQVSDHDILKPHSTRFAMGFQLENLKRHI